MKPKTIIFFGSSGAGKGTQAELLRQYIEENDSDKRRVLYIETGKGLRRLGERDTYTSKLTKEVLNAGGLIPVFLPIWIWTNNFIEEYTGEEHMILDGLTRRIEEAPVLDSALRFYTRSKPQVIFINVSRDWSTARLTERAREDDKPEEIRKRLDWFEENTLPSVNFFKNHIEYDFHEINGEQPIEKVHADILSKVFASEEGNKEE